MARVMGFIIVLLLIIIGVMSWILFAPKKVEAPVTVATTTTPAVSTNKPTTTVPAIPRPLHERVAVSSPKSGAILEKTFDVTGKAPGNWFFEATFPIQVRDPDGNVLGRAHANAQGEWMTENLVTFTTMVNIEGAYKGPATLILLRDNPSGLPENNDSLEIPIVIK